MIQSIIRYTINNKYCLILLSLCLISRIFTSIFYFEDIDSLRFGLATTDFDILESRPHFPGYAIYCFLLQLLYKITHSISLSFSIIGGTSMFIIIYFSTKIHKLYSEKNNHVLSILLLINPFLWLMSNRYMPDIFGLALLIVGLYYFIKILKKHKSRDYLIFGILIGLECGVRLSFIPFFLPALILITNRKIFISILSLTLTILLWLIQLIYLTGYNQLIDILFNDMHGHFFKWGGTILSSDASLLSRILKIIEFIFVDGFSFWTPERHWTTLVNSLMITILIVAITFKSDKLIKYRKNKIIIFCFLSYLIWIFLFQNINYKPRHIIPFIPLLLYIFSVGFISTFKKKKTQNILLLIILIPHLYITIHLVNQHKSPSAISQITNFLEKKSNKKNIIFFTDGLKKFYFKNVYEKSNVNFLSENKINDKLVSGYINSGHEVYSFKKIKRKKYTEIYFFHNPYVNRLWSQLKIYKYE